MSPYLEPYHLVPLAVPAVVLLARATDREQRARVRLAAALGFVIGMAILKVSGPWPLRGLLVNAQALVLCGTAGWVTWAGAVGAPANAKVVETTVRRGRLAARIRQLIGART